MVNPGARFFIRRLSSGRILLINTPDPKQRKTLWACLGDDDDRAFEPALELDDRDRVSYPDAVEGPGGTIYAIHDHDRGGSGEIILNIFTEEEILAR